MFLSAFSPTVICGSELSAKKKEAVGGAAEEVEDEVGVDIADALDLLTFKEDCGFDGLQKLERTSTRYDDLNAILPRFAIFITSICY